MADSQKIAIKKSTVEDLSIAEFLPVDVLPPSSRGKQSSVAPLTVEQARFLSALVTIYSERVSARPERARIPRNPFANISGLYGQWKDAGLLARRAFELPGRVMDLANYSKRNAIKAAESEAQRKVLHQWAVHSGLDSESGWVEDWIEQRFREGPPVLAHWLSMLARSSAPAPQEGPDPRELGGLIGYKRPTSKRAAAEMIRRFRQQLDRDLKTLGRRQSHRADPNGRPAAARKAGKYKNEHFEWLAWKICGWTWGRIAKKFKLSRHTTVIEGARSCADLLKIRWPVPPPRSAM